MKKLLSLGLLTACALVASEHPAQAWVNSKFSVGLNWHLQSANNNVLWGAWKNGQVPGPEAFGPGQFGPINGPGPMPPAGTFPFYGSSPNQTPPPPQTAYNPAPYYYNPYQSVSYSPPAPFYPNGYYPNYYEGSYQNCYQNYYQAPAYWYQGR